jgi:hypothetical protein
MCGRLLIVFTGVCAGLFGQSLWAVAEMPDSAPAFNRSVLPILADHCFPCHGADVGARKAGLNLYREQSAKSALESGNVAVVAGDTNASALYRRITAEGDERMPPSEAGEALSAAEIDLLGEWIAGGASWEAHWAYLPPVKPAVPKVQNPGWPRNAVDGFVLQRMEQVGLAPSREADRRTLIRRVYLDLIGLPPSPEAIQDYLQDSAPDAYARMVDAALASPHYGEKWARWWLDLAGYADSDGYLSDFLRPWAWRYRDWVVNALNRDMPFDAFTREQIAGDLLPNATVDQRIATGFFRNTTSNREGGADLEEYRTQQAADRTKLLGTTWLAATLECAQCHDHKYDAITQREFYGLYAFFNDADEVNIAAPTGEEEAHFASARPVYLTEREALLAPAAEALAALQTRWEEKLLWAADHPGQGDHHWDRAWEVLGLVWGQSQGEGQLEGTYIVRKPVSERTDDERIRLQDYFLARGALVDEAQFETLGVKELLDKLNELRDTLPNVSRAPTLRQARSPRDTAVHIRGDFRSRGDAVTNGTPAVLHALDAQPKPNRLDLAHWIVSPDNPLVSRVVVNRLWQEVFGRGLVGTSDDFGIRGDRPTHPELLDWLALRFVEDGWSVKRLLRTLALSATYRQSSDARLDAADIDPDNTLLARHTRTRLSAELVRDNALAASGLLNPTLGGPSVRPPQPASVTNEGFDNSWEASEGADRYRRGLYTFIQRTSPYGQLVNFDFPDTNRACTRRVRSNTPLQALNLLNDEAFVDAARTLASRTHRECEGNFRDKVTYVYEHCLARPAERHEIQRLQQLFESERERFAATPALATALVADKPDAVTAAAWVVVCSVVLNLDEFVTKE